MARGDRVLLIHGLWMTGIIMSLMQRRLEARGYRVECYSYPTLRLTLRENAQRLAAHCTGVEGEKMHLVGHSMGGLIALNAVALAPPPCLGRVVVAGTPFADSFSARRLERVPGGRSILGACIGEWLRAPGAQVAVEHEVGVIAGSGGVGLGRLIAPDLPPPNDGVITVGETHVPGMRDHIVLNVSHTQMLASREVALQICAFLDHGRFDRSERAAA